MNSPIWDQFYPSFTPVYITSHGMSCYALDNSGDVHYYSSYYSTWIDLGRPASAPIMQISASTDSSLIACDNDGEAYFHHGSWEPIGTGTSPEVKGVSAGSYNNYLMIDGWGVVTKYTDNSASTTLTAFGSLSRLSSTNDLAHVWAVDDDYGLFFNSDPLSGSSNNNWVMIPDVEFNQIDVSYSVSNTPQVCGVDTAGNGWMYDDTGIVPVWSSIEKPPGFTNRFACLEANGNVIWALLTNGKIYRGLFF